jgi:hypothetical protein
VRNFVYRSGAPRDGAELDRLLLHTQEVRFKTLRASTNGAKIAVRDKAARNAAFELQPDLRRPELPTYLSEERSCKKTFSRVELPSSWAFWR